MSEAERAVELIFPGHKFGFDDPERSIQLAEMGVGGFCLYGGRPDEVAAFTQEAGRRAPRPPLFNADYEDGVATQCPGGTPLPSNMGLGASGSEEAAFEKGRLTAVESRAMGVPWVLAPVCDLATAPDNPIVNVRSFSSDPALVAKLASAYLRGLRSEGALGCVKHFPGHGETLKDSHLELPSLALTAEQLRARELKPFAALAAEADAVMTGHLIVRGLTGNDTPYSISADPKRTLRGELKFDGLISTDALNMQAINGRFDELEAARGALLGGADVLLVPADARALARALPQAVEEDANLRAAVAAALARLDRARAKLAAAKAPAPMSAVGCAAHLNLAEALAAKCLAWSGAPLPPLPKAVAYWEPESGPEEWLGEPFVQALRAEGREVTPWQEGAKAGALVIGGFLNPRAYTGRIRYDADELARVKAALKSAERAAFVSFGSPFAFKTIGAEGLCAFSKNEPAQRAAARALAGAAAVTGRMPVVL